MADDSANNLIVQTYTCKAKTQSACANEFLSLHPELTYVKVEGDGNCFFRALAEYYQRTGEQLDGVQDPTDFNELRQYIVREFGQQLESDYELREIFLPALNARPIKTILSELATTCTWNVPAFEMMVERTSTILNINLRLYRVNREKGKPLTVTESFYRPKRGVIPNATISIFLASNHYGLILPNNHPSFMSAVAANKKSSSKKKKPSSLTSQEQANINAAIEASMHTANKTSIKKKPTVGILPVAPLKVSPKASPNIASPNAAPNSYHSTSSVSSIESLNNSLFIENAREKFPYKQMTIPLIKNSLQVYKLRGILERHGITYHAKDKKEVLYDAFMDAYIANTKEKTKNILKKKKQETMQSKKGGKNAQRITRKNKQR